MTKVVLSPAAQKDMIEIGDYIAFRLHNKSAARNTINKIQSAVLRLQSFPESGTPLLQPSQGVMYRYLICGNYMIFYYLRGSCAYVDRILYGRRDYLTLLFGEELEETE